MASDLPIGIDVQTTKALLDADSLPLLLDCRQEDEYSIARIRGAVLIPMSELPQRLPELQAHRDARIVVHCHHGGRSLRVANWLRAQGFSQAQTMEGGIDAWSQVIDPSVPRY